MTWLDVNDSRPGFNGFGRIDPYIDWIFGTEGGIFRNERVAKRFPLLVRPRNRWTPAQFATAEFFTTSPPSAWAQTVCVPAVYARPAHTIASRSLRPSPRSCRRDSSDISCQILVRRMCPVTCLRRLRE